MAALQCEICGGKLVGKPGGIFECDSCGMEYSTEWAKAKIQEIKGTVKVEGTVEVTGKVQVDGGNVTVEGAATKESLLKRVKMCCAEKQWEKAEELLEQVLNIDPECAEAYLYSCMRWKRMRTPEELHSAYADVMQHVNESRDIEKAFRFAAGETAEMLAQWEQDRQAAIEEDRKHRQKMRGVLETRRKLIEPAKKRIVMGEGYIVGLRIDGTVVATGCDDDSQCNVRDWRGITAIACGDNHTVGLCADGTVVATGCDDSQCNVRDWRNIVAIACGFSHTVGLRLDGTVVATGGNMYGQCDVSNWRWKNIVAVACSDRQTVGLCADGTVVTTDEKIKDKCDTSEWKLFDSIDTLAEELEESRKAAKAHRLAEQRAEEERRLAQQEAARAHRAELEQERDALKTELASLKGIFAGIRRRDIETRLEQIETGLESYKED